MNDWEGYKSEVLQSFFFFLNHVLNNTLFVPGLFLLIPNDFIYIHLYFPKYVVK